MKTARRLNRMSGTTQRILKRVAAGLPRRHRRIRWKAVCRD